MAFIRASQGGGGSGLIKADTFNHTEGYTDTVVTCGFKPKYVAITKDNKGRIAIYDERISTSTNVTAVWSPAYNENATNVQVHSSGFTIPASALETGTYYYFAIG